MRALLSILAIFAMSFASEGETIFRNSCLGCHQENSRKPLSFLKQKYKNRSLEVIQLAKNCPWGKNLSDLEIELVSKWLADEK
ncbi:MAG: cytochrome c [Aquificaceae bacterium]